MTTWNAWNLIFICDECETKLREDARCPYCKGDFLHLRASEFRKHMEICKKELENLEDAEPKCPECGNPLGSPVFGDWGDAVSECSCGYRLIE